MAYAMEGLNVLDISQGVPGSLAGMQFGDLGASVIKVEPVEGDWLRRVGPYINGESSLFIQLNRNKRDIAVNAKTSEGREILQKLANAADVLIDAYRPGVAERLGVGFEALAKRNPRLVYLAISAFGREGPMAHEAGTELAVQSLVGNNRQLGVAGQEPLRVGFDMASISAAWAGVQGTMAALYARERTGKGQRVDTSMLAGLMAIWQWNVAAESKPDEWRGLQLTGYADPPDHGFRTKDLGTLINFRQDEEAWQKFCRAIDAAFLIDDPRFTAENRRANDAALKSVLGAHLASWSYEDVRRLVRELEGTVVPMHDAASLFADPQVVAIKAIGELAHPIAGTVRMLNPPWHFNEPIVKTTHKPAPALGEHTNHVLDELGYQTAEITALRDRQIVR